MPPHRSGISKSVVPRPATGDSLGLLRQRCGPLPAADCRAGRSSSVWAASFLLTASNSICSPWITGPYNMHATALNALAEWGRVHEVRRAQPKLSGALIFEFDVSSPPRASPDSYLWPGHTFRVRCYSWLACVVSRTHMSEYGSYQRLHGRRFSFLTTGVAGTSLGHVRLCKERRALRPWRVPVG